MIPVLNNQVQTLFQMNSTIIVLLSCYGQILMIIKVHLFFAKRGRSSAYSLRRRELTSL
jgi:hypothetical protein